MTDLLGVCVAWGEGRCVIAPESGDPVEIRLADIVSGKPVPPRPSPRLRVSPRAAEEHTRWLWPHLEVEALGEWQLRSDPAPVGRLRKRANSCLAFGSPGLPLPAALARVEAFYAARRRDVVVQVPLGGDAGDLESALVDRGWTAVPGGDAHFMLASLSRTLRTARRHPVAAEPGAPAVGEPALEESGDQAVVRVGEAAVGRAAYHDDWLGLHGLDVDPAYRRRGLATRVVAELLEWGAERGATTAWLHVEVDNSPAIALYEALGFTRHHACRYLVPRRPTP